MVITVRSHRVSWRATQTVYLWTLAQEMPTAYPVRRRKSNNFQREFVDKFGRFSREWLEWVAREKNITLKHKSNNKEKTLGDRHLRVDGWDAENNTVYRFHRSFFHGYDCHKTEGCGDVNLFNKSILELRQATKEITQYLINDVESCRDVCVPVGTNEGGAAGN